MTATLVDDRLTPLTVEQLATVLHDGSAVVLGEAVGPACLSVVLAQACLETGNGQKVHCWNFGNAKPGSNWDGLVCEYKCDEIVSSKAAAQVKQLGPCEVYPWKGELVRIVVYPGHPWSRFRAFSTAIEGAAEYLGLLVTRFSGAWNAAYRGDAAGFVACAKAEGYFTADLDTYTHAVVNIAKKVRPVCERICGAPGGELTDADRDEIMGLVALTMSDPDSRVALGAA